MKRFTIYSRLTILSAILLLCLSVVAQQHPDTAVKQELALAVDRGDGRPWEITAFNGGGGEAANFTRIKSWKPSNDEAPVVGVGFKITREAEVVIANLYVKLDNDKEVMVDTYRLREGETTRTEALAKFGVEPWVLRVVKAKPPFKDTQPAITPKVENKTKAIEVVSLDRAEGTLDHFKLSLRNVSNKKIIAIDLFIPSPDGNGGAGHRSSGGDNERPLIAPGDIFVDHVGISRGGRMTPEGFVPDAMTQQTLIIRTVIFDDGTYDGLVEPAAEMDVRRRGRDIQRRRILSLLQQLGESKDGIVAATPNDVKELAYALAKTSDASAALELITRFPSLDEKSKESVIQNIEVGLRDGKLELLRKINDFEERQKQPSNHMTFAEWIKQTKTIYEKLTATP